MTSQYTKASAVKKYLAKKIKEQVTDKEMENFSFDVFKTKDRENQEFLWIDLIDQGNFADNSFNQPLLEKVGVIIKESIHSNCPNLMEIVTTGDGAGRQLLWLPKDKNCQTLYEYFENIEEFSLPKSKRKPKF